MVETLFAKIIEFENYKFWYFNTTQPRLETFFSFHIDHFSQKLVYKIMDLTHSHGFSCASPIFKNENDLSGQVVFCIGARLPSKKSLNKYLLKLHNCLKDISNFNKNFSKQLDFSIVDLSMFDDVDFSRFDLLTFATVRDQYYNGSWDEFYNDMINNNKNDEAKIIDQCRKFEKENGKDIALVSNQLDIVFSFVEEATADGAQQ